MRTCLEFQEILLLVNSINTEDRIEICAWDLRMNFFDSKSSLPQQEAYLEPFQSSIPANIRLGEDVLKTS